MHGKTHSPWGLRFLDAERSATRRPGSRAACSWRWQHSIVSYSSRAAATAWRGSHSKSHFQPPPLLLLRSQPAGRRFDPSLSPSLDVVTTRLATLLHVWPPGCGRRPHWEVPGRPPSRPPLARILGWAFQPGLVLRWSAVSDRVSGLHAACARRWGRTWRRQQAAVVGTSVSQPPSGPEAPRLWPRRGEDPETAGAILACTS